MIAVFLLQENIIKIDNIDRSDVLGIVDDTLACLVCDIVLVWLSE